MEIAVLGGSNGGYAAAADLALAGHEVRFWRRDPAAFQPVLDTGTICLTDSAGTRDVSVALATLELAEAVDGAELVLIPLPATAQPELAARLAPLLDDGQVVYMPPGTFGTYLMARAVAEVGNPARVAFAEAGTLPYLTRLKGPSHVAIRVRATRLPTGVFPARETERACTVIGAAYPAVEPRRDALDAALMNAGPILHPPLIIMNAGPLEHFETWDIHNEGTQPSIRRVIDALDAERITVREALGYEAPHFPLADHYDDARDEWMYGNSSHERLTDSGDWRERIVLTAHRYMLEDVALGVALLVSAGSYAGVPTPVARGLVALSSVICDEDFMVTGRTFESLGLAGASRDALQALLDDGIPA